MKKVTVRDVGRAAGVSHATVSRVLNNDPRVHSRTRLRVIRAMRELDYRPEFGVWRRTLAMILSSGVGTGYMSYIMMSLRNEMSRRGYHTELVSPRDIGILNERIISGAISVNLDDDFHAQWNSFNLPLVQINRRGNVLDNVYTVRSDGESAMGRAVHYLHERGHRRIAYLAEVSSDRDREMSSRRNPGFVEAMRSMGCAEPERWMFYRVIYESPDFLRLSFERVTAVICVGEMTGIRVARDIQMQGLRIPEDFSLISMEHHGVSEALFPAQTTLAQNFDELSSRAMAMLEKLIAGEAVPGDVSVPYDFIERESVRSILS